MPELGLAGNGWRLDVVSFRHLDVEAKMTAHPVSFFGRDDEAKVVESIRVVEFYGNVRRNRPFQFLHFLDQEFIAYRNALGRRRRRGGRGRDRAVSGGGGGRGGATNAARRWT